MKTLLPQHSIASKWRKQGNSAAKMFFLSDYYKGHEVSQTCPRRQSRGRKDCWHGYTRQRRTGNEGRKEGNVRLDFKDVVSQIQSRWDVSLMLLVRRKTSLCRGAVLPCIWSTYQAGKWGIKAFSVRNFTLTSSTHCAILQHITHRRNTHSF